MQTKLTLKLDDEIIRLTKEYGKEKNESLSKLVEDFFRSLTTIKSASHKYSPLVEELSGVISVESIESIDENEYTIFLEKKYE